MNLLQTVHKSHIGSRLNLWRCAVCCVILAGCPELSAEEGSDVIKGYTTQGLNPKDVGEGVYRFLLTVLIFPANAKCGHSTFLRLHYEGQQALLMTELVLQQH